jgi:hypothetical protein
MTSTGDATGVINYAPHPDETHFSTISMSELSPAAKPVWDAYEELLEYKCVVTKTDMKALAAALRAAADQVVPDDKPSSFSPGAPQAFAIQRRTTRRQLLTIAAELETFAQ